LASIQRFAPGERMRRNIILALTAAVLLGVAVATQLLGAERGPMQQLVRAKPERTFAPRLSIENRYHDCTSFPADSGGTVPREECGTSDEGPGGLAASAESSAPDSLQASAIAALIWDEEPAALDAAIASLEKALRLTLDRVPVLVDLSAAHLVHAERTQNPRDLMPAIHYADEALALEPGNASAAFNSALAKQASWLDEEADRAWNAYLAIDSTSKWADEARLRQSKLITRAPEIPFPAPGASAESVDTFAAQYPQEAREYGFGDVLDDWGAAVAKGDSARADSLLDLAQGLGRALEGRHGGDASLADVVRDIRTAQFDPEATAVLARAHRAYAAGDDHFRKLEDSAASAALGAVARARPRSPVLLHWTALFQAGTRSYQGEHQEAASDLRALLAEVDSIRYPAMVGRARLMLGTVLGRSGHLSHARARLKEAAPYLEGAGEDEFLGTIVFVDAEAAYQLGDTLVAYDYMYRAMELLRPYRSSRELHKLLMALGRFAMQDELPRAALAIYNEDLAVAAPTRTPIDEVEVRLARAVTRGMLRDTLGARRDVDSAAAWTNRVPDEEAQRAWILARTRMARPDGLPAEQIDSAVEKLAVNPVWHVPALNQRANLLLAQDNVPRAIADLQTVTELVRRVTRQEGNSMLRSAVIEQARRSFDRLVMLHVRNRRPDEALRALEQGRMSFAPRRVDGVQPGKGRLAAPPGQVAVEYALIGDTLLVWTIGDSIRLWERRVDRDTFQLAVEQASATLESASAPIPRLALQSLYDWLIRPIRDHLGGTDTPLVILADGEVAGVPFAALLDGDRYLIEDRPLRFAATLEDAARPALRASGPVLLVADPAFDQDLYLALDSLPGARDEVRSLAGIYGETAVTLEGPAATRQAFEAQARGVSVIHYAGHAIFDDARPERSYLLLAGADTTGRLTAETVSGMQLDGTRLVVLSACRTLRSRSGRSGGFAGLSGALLAAGAGGVVGSLWEVDDRLTHPLMEEFHRRYRRTPDPARALREAQLEMLQSSDPKRSVPAAWAGFRYTGS
jgi:CHAT domain-containing protein